MEKKEISTLPEKKVEDIAGFKINPKSFEDAMKICELIASSDFAPKDYKGKPGNIFIAFNMANELGIPHLQALQGIAVVNGRPAIWGDLALALVMKSGLVEQMDERGQTEALDLKSGYFFIKRKGIDKPIVRTFTIDEAQKAGLWTKDGTWKNYPGRMLQLRARGFALRDGFADVLKGMVLVEEAEDYVKTAIDTTTVPPTKQLPQENKVEQAVAPEVKPEVTTETPPAAPGQLEKTIEILKDQIGIKSVGRRSSAPPPYDIVIIAHDKKEYFTEKTEFAGACKEGMASGEFIDVEFHIEEKTGRLILDSVKKSGEMFG